MSESSTKVEQKVVAVVGAGLAGSLAALMLANRGYKVKVYEKNADCRAKNNFAGKSINIALSHRGRKALRKVGLEQEVLDECVVMKRRLMHNEDGSKTSQPYGQKNEHIFSMGREMLNKKLLNKGSENPNIEYHFETKLTYRDVDLKNSDLSVAIKGGEKKKEHFEAILGCDGAYSAVRQALTRQKQYNYSQEYLDHGYKELSMPPKELEDGSKTWAMEADALHIWPRGDFMMIALPNPDFTFTVTLFMPWDGKESFNAITDEKALLAFFTKRFRDAIPLIPELQNEYFGNVTGNLVSIKCSPWHYNRTAVLGDAAHAIVPFYGQGMNASLQDVVVLDTILNRNNGNWEKALADFSKEQKPNADAISYLSHYNYIEMRSHTASRLFLLRRSFERLIERITGGWFTPLYGMVAFSDMPYAKVIKTDKKQQKLLDRSLVGISVAFLGAAAFTIFKFGFLKFLSFIA